jgi:FkbM family methyltransferase
MTIGLTARRAIRATANRAGIDVRRISSQPFGQDAWLDVQRLSDAWGASVQTVFDVGANVGQTSLPLRRRFPDARILAFEPHPRTYERLVAELADERIETFAFALGAEAGTADLFEYRFSELNSLLANAPYAVRFGEHGSPMPVSVRTIDDFCAEQAIAEIDLLKIDTEGYDLQVLEGARSLLTRGRVRFVYSEFNVLQERSHMSGGALLPIAGLLDGLGFHLVATYTQDVVPDGGLFVVGNALFALDPAPGAARPRERSGPAPHVRPRTGEVRRLPERRRRLHGPQAPRTRAVLAALGGVVAFLVAAALIETFTDRDWRLSALEWPEAVGTAALLVLVTTLLLVAAQHVASRRPSFRSQA